MPLIDAPSDLRLDDVPRKGRIVRAVRPFAAGSTIWHEAPAILVVRATARAHVCAACGLVVRDRFHAAALSATCEACNLVFYCNADGCQQMHAAHHAKRCAALQIVPALAAAHRFEEDTLTALLELFFLDADLSRAPVAAKVAQLLSAAVGDAMALSPPVTADLHTCVTTLVGKCAEHLELTRCCARAPALFGILRTNAHGDDAATRFGLFPGLSQFSHSCMPNCLYRLQQDGSMVVCVNRDVSAEDELCISYTPSAALYACHRTRRAALLAERSFACCCQRCEGGSALVGNDPLEAFSCRSSGCPGQITVPLLPGAPVVGDVVYCNTCATPYEKNVFEAFVDMTFGPLFTSVTVAVNSGIDFRPHVRALLDAADAAGMAPEHELLQACLPFMAAACEAGGEYALAASLLQRRAHAYEVVLPGASAEKMELYAHLVLLRQQQLKVLAEDLKRASAQEDARQRQTVLLALQENITTKLKDAQSALGHNCAICLGVGKGRPSITDQSASKDARGVDDHT